MHIAQACTAAVPVTLSKKSRTVDRSILAAAFVAALGGGSTVAWAQGAEWREHDGTITAYMNEAQYDQWSLTGRVPLMQGRVCYGGKFLGYGVPSAGEQGPSVYVVDCGPPPPPVVAPPLAGAAGCQEVKTMYQPVGPNVEAATIHVMNCPSGEIWIYQYQNRPGYRVIRPGNWGQAIGGRDFPNMNDALSVAGGGQPTQPSVPAQIEAALTAGPPDENGGCHGLKGYYRAYAHKGDTIQTCMKCPEVKAPDPLFNFSTYNGDTVCVRCPSGSGTHYESTVRACIPGAG